MAERDLVVRFIGDDRDLQRAFTNSERRSSQLQSRFTTLNQSLRGGIFGSGLQARGALLFGSGAFISTAAITSALRTSVTAATDLREQIDRTRVVLGDASDEVIEWSTTTATSIGISQRAALTAASTFAGLFQTVGVGPQKAAELSRSLVQLAADLASLQNTSPEEALLALRSGLIGEAEPLRRFNVFLSEARVAQEAMAETGKRNAAALTDQEKALARYNLILQDATPAQGNFRDTSQSLANQSRILRANLDDLAASLGDVLVPALADAAAAANLLFEALDKMRGQDFTPGFDFPDISGALKTALQGIPSTAAIPGLAEIIKTLADVEEAQRDIGAGGAPGPETAERIRQIEEQSAKDAKAAEDAARTSARNRARMRKAFAELQKGLGLKLDKAQLTATLADDLAALRAMEQAIERQIRREGRTFELVEALTAVRSEIQSTVAQQAERESERAREAWETLLGSLDLRLQQALRTASIEDDLRALAEIEQALRRRIAAEGKTLELERELFDVRSQIADKRREQAERQRDLRVGRQFEALGLTEEGQERVPGVSSLSKRTASLQEQIKGTFLDTEKTRSQLERIARVLSGAFGKVGRDVRQAILEMLNDITSALQGGPGQAGQLTKFQKTGIEDILEGVGLSAEEVKELRQRLSRVGPGGTRPREGQAAFGFDVTTRGSRGTGNIVVNGDLVVENPRDVDAFVREVQRRAQRSSGSRRGVRPGSNRGMG